MARGVRKSIEEKIYEKEEVIRTVEAKLERLQEELEALQEEKRAQELSELDEVIRASGMSLEQVKQVLQEQGQSETGAA